MAWEPTPKQQEFLGCSSFEVLFGGAAGGGKTDALIVDAVGWNQPGGPAIHHPQYRALMIRPELGELREVIERTQRMYPAIDPGAKYLIGQRKWRFSSGATIEFNYLKQPTDHLRYKGDEFQYIGWEELTLHPTNIGYIFLLTRLRRKPGMEGIIPCVRATTNPDGPGHSWVKKHWRIDDHGSATKFDIHYEVSNKKTGAKETITRTREYIPARLDDNPHIDEDYEANLLATSEDTQRAQREGRWDIVNIAGVIYQRQVTRVVNEGRLCHLPIRGDRPVDTYWDLGNDNVSIWFVQEVSPWIHLVDFFQGENEGLAYYIGHLRDRGYTYGRYYLPHDADHKRLGVDTAQSIRMSMNQLGIYEITVVPRVQHIRDGIELARQLFDMCRFDQVRCELGWEALKNYRFRKDDATGVLSQTPLHDWASHPADAFRQIAQRRQQADFLHHLATARDHSRGMPRADRARLNYGRALKAPKPLC